MKRIVFGCALLLAAILAYSARPAPPQGAPPGGRNRRSFRIVFGERQEAERNYSGSLSVSEGKVISLSPWRFFRGDQIQGNSAWKLEIKRGVLETQPDKPRSLAGGGPPQSVIPAGVVATVEAPGAARVEVKTAQGNFAFPLAEVRSGMTFLGGDVTVEPAATVERISDRESAEQQDYPSLAVTRNGVVWLAWQGYQDGGEHVYARHSTASGWSETFRLTDARADLYRTAVGEDAKGRVWVVWSERGNQEWQLYGRHYDGRQWSPRAALTAGSSPNISQRLVAGRNGRLHLVWVGHRDGKSCVFHRALDGDTWSAPVEVSGPSAWAPDAASDSQGNLYVTWDSYRTGNYDIFLRRVATDGVMDPIRQVTQSSAFQAHASVAVDARDRVWVAWDESGANWGKDWYHEDPWRATTLYTDRSIRVAVLEQGNWKQPADVEGAVPARWRRYWQLPRLASGPDGRVWMLLQVRTSSANNRADYWANNGRWEYFVTSYDGDRWSPLVPVPESHTRNEGAAAAVAGPDNRIWLAWTNDNRGFGPPVGLLQAGAMKYEIWAAAVGPQSAPGAPRLETFAEPPLPAFPVHPKEIEDVARIRGYRSGDLRILRGDFHRHTEISGDGAGDGSVEDYFRYMIDVAEMDTGIISDHNAGNDVEYTWWRTEKAIDTFLIPGRFTPLFGYERSVAYPNGHRNVVFAQRGVRTLPISPAENKGAVNSGTVLYPYLRQHRGIAMEHSLATGQGTDWRDNDPEVEPLAELYQGYHAAYEYEGGPRAETDNFLVRIHGGYQPAGFFWNALKKG
ncbi:MAG: DUF3604 domain-containing protein, partial [Acidobacteria bacterium]|nr:DUF3604 domain-containing protein [Acidobacteriota bacterium]